MARPYKDNRALTAHRLVRQLCALLAALALWISTSHPASAQAPARIRPALPAKQGSLPFAANTTPAFSGPVATQVVLAAEAGDLALVIDLSAEVRPTVSVMADPMRLVLDFPGLRFHAPSAALPEGAGAVTGLRFGAFMRGEGRVILELAAPLRIAEQRHMSLDGGGKRLVIRLEPMDKVAFIALAKPMADEIITGSTARAQAGAAPDLPLVFLDPGHGGIDSGASGPNGELEKALVLQFALNLKERLERGGKARVMLSRSGDVFVPLRDRVRMARQAKAQLFISIHADALPPDEGEARGATIYTLAERATDERAQRLAEKENRADLAAGLDTKDDQDEVADILFDLARRESRAFSGQFARQLVQTLPKATRLHRNPLRGAGFRVLRAPDVPSVLLELGYLTNADEARLMLSEDWRKATADAAAEAIERFLQDRVSRETGQP